VNAATRGNAGRHKPVKLLPAKDFTVVFLELLLLGERRRRAGRCGQREDGNNERVQHFHGEIVQYTAYQTGAGRRSFRTGGIWLGVLR
jgi:hypothetical protein